MSPDDESMENVEQPAPNQSWSQQPQTTEYLSLRVLYTACITLAGLILVTLGIASLVGHPTVYLFVLIVLFAILIEWTATVVIFGKNNSVVYEVGTAVCMALVPEYGPLAAAVGVAAAMVSTSLVNYQESVDMRVRLSRLGYNVGMHAIAIATAGYAFQAVAAQLTAWPVAALTVPWLVAAIVYDQVNMWLLIAVLHLYGQRGVSPLALWRDNVWAMPINIGLMSIGGGLLALAIAQYGWVAVTFFMLPIALTGYSFYAYTRRMEAHLASLEGIIESRTAELRAANDDLRSTNDALARTNQQLEEVNEAKNRFLAVLSHDMRSPLTGIILYSQMLSKQKKADPNRLNKMASRILNNANNVLELVDNLVEIEQSDVTEIQLKREQFELGGLVENIADSFAPQAVAKMIDVTVSGVEETYLIDADRQLMKRVFANLISNAIKYSADGSQVNISLRPCTDGVQVHVADNGFGIPANDLPLIFTPYHRVKQHRDRAKGTGLGLSIVKRYVEAHGGQIEVESTEGVGSTFSVRLPVLVA